MQGLVSFFFIDLEEPGPEWSRVLNQSAFTPFNSLPTLPEDLDVPQLLDETIFSREVNVILDLEFTFDLLFFVYIIVLNRIDFVFSAVFLIFN